MKLNSLLEVLIFTGLLLLIPLIAMQFTDKVNWTLFDFVIAAILIFTSGITIQFVRTRKLLKSSKIAFILLVIIVLLLIWIELAVGIFGTPFHGN